VMTTPMSARAGGEAQDQRGGQSTLLVTLVLAVLMLSATPVCQAVFTPVTQAEPVAPWAARQAFATWTYNNSIYLAGGTNGFGSPPPAFNDVWASPDGGLTWLPQTSLGAPTGAYGASAVYYQNYFFVLGGRKSSGTDSNTVYRSQATSGLSWTAITASWAPASFAMAIVWTPPAISNLNQSIIFIGGTESGVGYFNTVWMLSSPTGTWTEGPSFPTAITGAGITTTQGGSQIVVAGGSNGPNLLNSVYLGVWESGTFPTWLELTTAAPWSARLVTLASTAAEYIYLIDGPNEPASAGPTYSNDVTRLMPL
jgi:hypothetical protein